MAIKHSYSRPFALFAGKKHLPTRCTSTAYKPRGAVPPRFFERGFNGSDGLKTDLRRIFLIRPIRSIRQIRVQKSDCPRVSNDHRSAASQPEPTTSQHTLSASRVGGRPPWKPKFRSPFRSRCTRQCIRDISEAERGSARVSPT